MASSDLTTLSAGTARTQAASAPVLARIAWVAAVFCAVVCAALIFSHFRAKAEDPLNSPELVTLKERLLTNRNDQATKEQVRALDLELRRRYFHQLSLTRSGSWLALGGAVIFLLVSKSWLQYHKQLPLPQPRMEATDEAARRAKRARRSVLAVSALTFLTLASLTVTSNLALPKDLAAIDKILSPEGNSTAPVADFASADEMQRNWPRFRGPGGNGVSMVTNVPVSWDVKTGAAIAWKTDLTAPGFNSPIVWGDRVFLSGGDATNRSVLCFGASRGELLWEQPVKNVPGSPAQAPEISEQTGYAASTLATDGRRVYALFANGDLVAFGLDGKLAWSKNIGVPKNPYGHAASLLTCDNRLILQLDQGSAEQNLSKLIAFDGATGRVLWQRNRPVGASWSSPIAILVGNKWQIVTLAVPWVIAYSAPDGAEAWRAEGLSNEVTPSPIFAGGLVLAVSPSEKLMAIRPDGQGDVTKTHIAWSAEDNIPDVTSPVSNGELVFTVSTAGVVTCYDLKDGKKIWEQDLSLECQGSPTIAGNRLYILAAKGQGVVAEAGRTYKELGRGELDDKVYASPAFAPGKMFVRGIKHLFCISLSAAQSAEHPGEARP
jgi:outer membrane protein assembly factor BamB